MATQSVREVFFSRNPGISEALAHPALNVVGTMLRSDEVFSILFVHILLVKKILRLLFDSSSYSFHRLLIHTLALGPVHL
jgi:hypothetical protein